MTQELIALLDGRKTGRVVRDKRGKLTFIYYETWRQAADAYPLSISMPVALAEHSNATIDPFLWGLLPDNEIVLDHWARKFHVSARNAFSLIAHVGEDCAGAVQFVEPKRLDAILNQPPPPVEWLDEAGVAERLRTLRQDHSAWRIRRDTGQFSLAGSQPKTALLFDEGKWGVPSGRIPTTHILKPPSGDFDGHVENEHFCLELARALGLPVVESRIMRFHEEIAIVVERFDRVHTPAGLHRVHQEDLCQTVSVPPTRKYQSEGGPGIRTIVDILKTYSSRPDEDVGTFIDSIAYNWLTAGTDAHAKNYALLIGASSRVRLAPLYDVASVLPYRDIDLQRVKLSMKIGGEYRLRNITRRNWQKLGHELHLDPDAMIERVESLAARFIQQIPEINARVAAEGLAHPIIPRLVDALAARGKECRQILHRKS